MAYGFSYNGKHSDTFGIIMHSKNRVMFPARNDKYEEIPGRDGSILFPGAFADRFIELECGLAKKSLSELRKTLRQIAAWLSTSGKAQLIFDDEPDLYYLGRIANQIDLEQTMALGRFTFQFRCAPLAFSVGGYEIEEWLTTVHTMQVNNEGTYDALPVITITAFETGQYRAVEVTGAYDPDADELVESDVIITNPTITVSVSEQTQTLRWVGTLAPGENLVVNCETMQAVKGEENAIGGITEGFPVLRPGANEVELVTTNLMGGFVKVQYIERWL